MRTLLTSVIALCLLFVSAGQGFTSVAEGAPIRVKSSAVPGAQATDCTPGPNKVLIACIYNGQDVSGADFSGSDLTSATFNGANVAGSNFSNANLTSATLNGANLSCSNFNGANLTAATLDGANFLGSTFDGALLVSTTWGTSTTCPDGTISGDNANSCVNNLQPAACGIASTSTTVAVATETTEASTATDVPDSGTETPSEGGDTPTGSETPASTPPESGTGTAEPPSELPNTGIGEMSGNNRTAGLLLALLSVGLLLLFGSRVGRRSQNEG